MPVRGSGWPTPAHLAAGQHKFLTIPAEQAWTSGFDFKAWTG